MVSGSRAFALSALVVVLTAGLVRAGPLAAQQGGTVRGRIVAETTGEAVEGAMVTIGGTSLGASSGADGRYVVTGVPAGARRVMVEVVGFAPTTRDVTVAQGGEIEVDFTLTQRAILLPSLVVSATREAQRIDETATSVGVISGATLAEVKPTHPAEIMSRIPGVWTNRTSGEGHMMSIRMPMSTDPVYLYLENGVPTRSTGFFNHNALYEVDVPQAARIEVLKGPSTALYGSDAIGGVIDVETPPPSPLPEFSVDGEGGAFGYGRLLLSGSDTWGRDGLRADINLTRTDGWRAATGYNRQSGTFTWDRDFAGGETLRTVLSLSRIDQQTAGSSALLRDDYLHDPTLNYTPISMRDVGAVRLTSAFEEQTDASLFSVTPYLRWNTMKLLPNWSLSYDPTVYTTSNGSVGALLKARHDFAPIRTRVIAGVDLDYSPGGHKETQVVPTVVGQTFTDYARGDLLYDYDVAFHEISPYVQVEASPTDRLHLNAGLRYDRMGFDYDSKLAPLQTGRWRRPADTDVSYDHFSPKIGAAYEFGTAFNVYANYKQGFRTPNENQLFRQGSAVNTVDLDPVTADSYEAGARGELLGRLGYTLAVYRMTVANDILAYVRPDGLRETQNAGETLHRGIEVSLGAALTDELRADVSYSYAKHTYERWSPRPDVDYAGNEQESAPHVLMNSNLAYTPSFLPGSRFALGWSRMGAYWMDAENTHRYDGHDLFDFHADVQVSPDVAVVGRVLNIFDTRYAETSQYTEFRGEEYAPGLPRRAYLAIRYTWGR